MSKLSPGSGIVRVLQAGREVGDEGQGRFTAAPQAGEAVRGDAVDEAVQDPLQGRLRVHGRQAADVAAVHVRRCGDPVAELPVAPHVLVGRVGLIDVGVHVTARRVPDLQQLADDGVLVPRLVDGEVGLREAEPLQRGRRIVVEEPAAFGVEVEQLEELPAARDRCRRRGGAPLQQQHVVEGDQVARLGLEQPADRIALREALEHRHLHGGGDDVPLVDVTDPDAVDGERDLRGLEGVDPGRRRGRAPPAEDLRLVATTGDSDELGCQGLGRRVLHEDDDGARREARRAGEGLGLQRLVDP